MGVLGMSKMSNTATAQELLKLKEKIDQAKTSAARLEGQISQLVKQRTEEFGCTSDEEAEEYIRELTEDVERLEREVMEGLASVKEELGWE